MAASVDSPSPVHLNKASRNFTDSPPLFSPSSDKRFWSTLRSRIDSLLESRNPNVQNGPTAQSDLGVPDRAKRLKEDSMLLLRGFDSVAQTLSQLSNNIDNALQGARNLSRPPTLTDIFHRKLNSSETEVGDPRKQEDEEGRRGLKRKFDTEDCSEYQKDDEQKNCEQNPKDKKLMKAKNIAISMARKAASLARELKSLKSDLGFVQERCSLLEEENRRLRNGFEAEVKPEEDDLMRLQMEALLAEKSRLANENAHLIRENQCLYQLVEYHQITSQDLSASYEQVVRGMCLDFSSPLASAEDGDENKSPQTPKRDIFGISTSLDEIYQQEQEDHQKI